MRLNIVHPGAGELKYEIRSIVEFANRLKQTGLPITWENIGDPIAKGEKVPDWITEIVAGAAKDSMSYAYSPTKGLNRARNYLAKTRTDETGNVLNAENILFFNGLGDAITKVYTWLNPKARVLGPSPAYPTHSSVEGAHGRSRHLTYDLDPDNNWLPDLEDIEKKIIENPNITALLIINPDNPTGMVYPREVLERFVEFAKKYDLFLIADEIYANLAFKPESFTSIAEVAQGVPTIVMRGLSKEIPWPGSRCGWLEFYNVSADTQFEQYVASIEEAKMIEVCSTTLPQQVLPDILGDERYPQHLRARTTQYQMRGKQATGVLNLVKGVRVIEPKGAFYLVVGIDEDVLHASHVLEPANDEAAKLLTEALSQTDESELDKRFCLQLLAHSGICVVPLTTGFNSHIAGFRMTLLEADEFKFTDTLNRLSAALTFMHTAKTL